MSIQLTFIFLIKTVVVILLLGFEEMKAFCSNQYEECGVITMKFKSDILVDLDESERIRIMEVKH